MEQNKLLLTKEINFKFNPYGGIGDDELNQTLVPNNQLSKITQDIRNDEIRIIEIVGRKGRGKTSHLKFLHQLFPKGRLFLLNSKTSVKDIIRTESNLIFIDSIHHMSLLQRLKLYKTKKKTILTTHSSRAIEFLMSNKTHKSYSFKGINNSILIQIIKKRISVSSGLEQEHIELNENEIKRLILKYGDNYRAILNYLFDNHKCK